MGVCCVIGCKNRSKNIKEGISIHRIPINMKKRKIWLQIMNGIHKNTEFICSDHFLKECFTQKNNRKVLLEHAVPSLFQCCPQELLINKLSVPKENLPTSSDYLKLFENIPGPSGLSPIEQLSTEVVFSSLEKVESKRKRQTISRTTLFSPLRRATRIISPKTQSLLNNLEHVRKTYSNRLRKLQQNKRRNVWKIANLTAVLKNLKTENLLNSQQILDLKNVSNSNQELLKRQIEKQSQSRPPQYSAELRKFALTLHYYSTSAYNYVRKSFDSCLPHPKTISRWYNSNNGDPGFTSEAFKAIFLRSQYSDYPLVGSLSLGEMSIEKRVEFDGSKYHGFVEYGINNDDDSMTQASHVIAFMVVCINDSWKIPVGYFFVAGINAEQRANLVIICLKMCHESNIKIISVTFDGDATNMAMLKELGCDFDNNITCFKHPISQENIYAYPDPCNMIKHVRNTFGNKKIFLDENDRKIEWKYIELLEELQDNEGSHIGNKMKKFHVKFNKLTMKVRLATQLLSESVACSLEFCRDHLLLPNFKDCAATVEFIRNFNILFAVLNSKNILQAGFKKPLCENNSNEIFEILNSIELYISNLKLFDKTPLIISKRKTGFIGLIICIQSLKNMFSDLITKSSLLKYIPAYKLNQDHLELFFGIIRGHGGYNNNLTARQFRAAYKKTLTHMELQTTNTGNYISLEYINILHCSGTKNKTNSLDIINMSSLNYRSKDPLRVNPDTDHTYYIESLNLSEYSNNVIAYTAVFVVRYLQQHLLCETCADSLEISANHDHSSYHTLIDFKNKGGLLYPSNDVINVCRITEKLIKQALAESGGIFLKKKYSVLYIVSRVLNHYSQNMFLFKNLGSHMKDNNILENHVNLLIRAIAEKYINVRLHYILKKNGDKDRAKSNRHKLLLFNGQ